MDNCRMLTSALLVLSPSIIAQQHSRPNIVFIMSDDHSYQTISAYGHPLSKVAPTPNIDRIARAGMVFNRAYVENSISSPSRATNLTGMYSHKHGQNYLGYAPSKLDTSRVFFVELLQNAGYETALFGKWHLMAEPRGFDYFEILDDQGEYYNPSFRTPDTNGNYIRHEGYSTTLITQHALNWLKQAITKENPFCLLIHHKAPHRNWMPDLKYLDYYEDAVFPEPENLFERYSDKGSHMQTQELTIANDMGYAFDFKIEELKDEPTKPYIKQSWDLSINTLNHTQRKVWDIAYSRKNNQFLAERPVGRELVSWKYQRYIKDYCRTIKSIDDEVGNVLDFLDQNGLTNNTIIVYTSDQGFFMGEHGLYDKRMIYEESAKTPLIIAYPPLIKANQKCNKLVQNIDNAPTLLSLAGLKIPKEMDGISLSPLFVNPDENNWRTELYYHYYDYPSVGMVRKHYGLITEKYKLVHWYGKGYEKDAGIDIDYWELFDLTKSSEEKINYFNHKKYRNLQVKLMKQVSEIQKAVGSKGSVE